MSRKASDWAWEQKVGSLAEKCVLVALAQYADSDTGECWPSIDALAAKTESNKKTVLKCISALKEKGLIEDTGERRGRTKSIIVYGLKHTQNRSISKIGAYPNLEGSIPKNGTPPLPNLSPCNPSLVPSPSQEPIKEPPPCTPHGGNGAGGNGSSPRLPPIALEWNQHAAFHAVKDFGPKRKAHLSARMTEPFFRDNYKEAIQRTARSDFCTGKGQRAWRADIDWLLRPGTVTSIMEGKYDNPKKPPPRVV